MFKSAELPWLITFFQMFYNDKPVDWLLEHLIYTKVCNWEKDMVSFDFSFPDTNKPINNLFLSRRNTANTKKPSYGYTTSPPYSNTSA
jgi:hypothetical protein